MNTENTISQVGDGWKLSNGNAQSEQTYGTYEEAKDAMEADGKAWAESNDAAEAEKNSPVDWET